MFKEHPRSFHVVDGGVSIETIHLLLLHRLRASSPPSN